MVINCSVSMGDRTRNNGFKLQWGILRLDMRKNFLTLRDVKCWNRLPRRIAISLLLEVFRCIIDKHLSGFILRLDLSRSWPALFFYDSINGRLKIPHLFTLKLMETLSLSPLEIRTGPKRVDHRRKFVCKGNIISQKHYPAKTFINIHNHPSNVSHSNLVDKVLYQILWFILSNLI